ncbi:hypothetical protein Tco_0617372 [Tanacetum coccineum]
MFTLRDGKSEMSCIIPDKGDLSAYWKGISSEGDFLGTSPSYKAIIYPILRLAIAPGPEKQPDATAGALEVIEGALDVDEGAYAVPSPVQAPQPPAAAQGFCIRRIQDLAGKKSTTLVEYP